MSLAEPDPSGAVQLEFPFTLPIGYSDDHGILHRDGVMRLATAYDEIAPLGDPRVRNNPGYLVIILLSRVVTQLGSIEFITPQVFEQMLAADVSYLQDLYERINQHGHARIEVACPHCAGEFDVEVASLGG